MTTDTARAEEIARAAYGKLVAILARRGGGDIMAAEDALADAFERALRLWPAQGVPANPTGWLLTVAKNKQTDAARKGARMVASDEVPEMEAEEITEHDDARLRLLYVCAHPAIDRAIRTPLMLQTVLGLEAAAIATAFLVPPTAMAQRLVRAKKKIKAAGIPFVIPEPEDRAARNAAVREAIYGAFAVDWLEDAADLTGEAFFLAASLVEADPADPEAKGLAALIAFSAARAQARVRDGMLVPVQDQDASLWDQALIDRAARWLTEASAARTPGRFQLEAAIQAVHAARAVTGRTDWRALSQLHAGLEHLAPSIGAAVARAAVVGEDAGPEQGLAMLARIDGAADYQPALATRAHLLARLGDVQGAAAAYRRAEALSTHAPTRRFLAARRAALPLS
ncbi:MAG: RNA polymerase sigma factor [Shimia sp.]